MNWMDMKNEKTDCNKFGMNESMVNMDLKTNIWWFASFHPGRSDGWLYFVRVVVKSLARTDFRPNYDYLELNGYQLLFCCVWSEGKGDVGSSGRTLDIWGQLEFCCVLMVLNTQAWLIVALWQVDVSQIVCYLGMLSSRWTAKGGKLLSWKQTAATGDVS